MAQKYSKKISKAATAECRNRRKVRLMILIITIAAGLFEASEYNASCITDIVGIKKYTPDFDGYFGLFLMFVAAAFGAFAVFGVFSDLTNKQTADVQLSLPMSAKDRYLSKLLAVGKLHLLPIICSSLFVFIVGVIKGHVIPGQTLTYLLQIHGVILAEALFVDAVCIFCMSCCGAKAEGVYTSIITGICASFTPYLVYSFTIETFSGVSVRDDVSGRFFASFGGLVAMCLPDTDLFVNYESVIVMLINMAISCLLIYATFFIYRKRDGRQVGKPMVYDLFMELFMFTGLFTLFTLFAFIGSWGIGLTIAVIIYLVIRIVAARAKITPKIFAVWLIKYSASLALFVVIMAAGYFTGGFGHYKLRMRKIYNETVRVNMECVQYHEDSVHGVSHDTNSFRNSYYIKEKFNSSYFDGMSIDMISQAEMEDKLARLNALIDKYYTLEDHSLAEFEDIMISNKTYFGYSDQKKNYVYISLFDTNDRSIRYKDENYYSVTFPLPAEKFDAFISEANEIFPMESRSDEQGWQFYEDEY